MSKRDRRARYVSLWLLALAFGWIEASVVVYLREIAGPEPALQTAAQLSTSWVPLVTVPSPFLSLEIVREASTMILLMAVGWLAGRRGADRIGAFLLSFGIWDITYYVVLWLVTGSPDSIRTWDILFLIPSPWVAPVWAPATVAMVFVVMGSYLFWTTDRPRQYRWWDAGVFVASAAIIVAAFLAGSQAIIEQRRPERFPLLIYWLGVLVGTAWFVRAERRGRAAGWRGRAIPRQASVSTP